jgi:hypothetical protein
MNGREQFMVTRLKIDPGNCMMKATVTVQRKPTCQKPNIEVDVCLETMCRNLDAFKEKYRTVSIHSYPEMMKDAIPHCICPIPLGVAKACEMEMGIGLRKDIRYELVRE